MMHPVFFFLLPNKLSIPKKRVSNSIGEVVVTGYQDVRRPRMTGSVSTIKSADIAKLDVRSMDQILKGTKSGVVASYNGWPGSDVKLQIRGANSMSGSTDPMWIVDGMPITGTAPTYRGQQSLENMLTQSGIGDIAPSDIESISVLRMPQQRPSTVHVPQMA